MTLRAYFFLGGKPGSAGLVPVLRDVPQSTATAAAAMNALLAGPSVREGAASPAISTMIPAGTRLLGLSIEDRVATVDLSSEFEAGGGRASCLGRLGQVVFTLTQFASVSSVQFRVDGRPVYAFGCEGIVLDRPVGRLTDGAGQTIFEDILPAIFVDGPAWGAALENPGSIRGTSNVFEAQFKITLLDRSGRTIFEDGVHATCGTGCRGDFQLVDDATIMNGVSKAQWGTLRVWDRSERDGSPILVREYPVWLLPAEEICGC
jgi:germination protein M